MSYIVENPQIVLGQVVGAGAGNRIHSPDGLAGPSCDRALTNAERARRRRRRERENLHHLSLDAPCAIIDRLIDDGYLAVVDAGDRRAEERALEAYLADQIEER